MPPVTLTAQCRALTPMLAGGANPWEHFELRASEVKSALRFWWRAFHDFADPKAMFLAESKVFGGKVLATRDGKVVEEAVAAPFRLNARTTSKIDFYEPGVGQESVTFSDGKTKMQACLGDIVTQDWGDGVRYIFYAILHYTGKIQNIATKAKGRQVAKEGFTFNLRFTFRRPDRDLMAEVLRSLWLLMNLGGLGARSRRGAGCFVITDLTPSPASLGLPGVPAFSPADFATPAAYLRAGLNLILERWLPKCTYFFEPPYTAFRPGISEIHILTNPTVGLGRGALQAMDAVGCLMKKYRYINPYNEAQKMHAALHGGTTPAFTELTKAQLGLPLIYNFRGPGQFGSPGKPAIFGGYSAQGVVSDGTNHDFGNKNNADRRSSPLLISCHAWTDGTGYAVVCHLPAPLLPEGQKIWLKAKDGYAASHHVCDPPSDYSFTAKLIQGTDKSLDKGFAGLTSLWTRTGPAGAAGPSSGGAVSPPSPPAAPQARKVFYLQQARARDDGLAWHLGEISGPPQGQGKKQSWPCRLWRLAGEELQEVPGDWRLRAKEVPLSDQPRLCTGSLLLCTIQADGKTPNPGNFLYNFQRLP